MCLYYILLVKSLKFLSCSEEKTYTPNTRQRHYGVDDSADKGILSAAEPRHYVKLEKSDASPVECTHDGEFKGDPIHYHKKSRFLPAA